jgi:hypothetical protein
MHAWVVTAGHSLTGLDHMACRPYSIQRISCSFAQSGRPKFLLKNHSLSAVYATVNEVRALITMKHQCHCFYCSFRACVRAWCQLQFSAQLVYLVLPLLSSCIPSPVYTTSFVIPYSIGWSTWSISQGKKEKRSWCDDKRPNMPTTHSTVLAGPWLRRDRWGPTLRMWPTSTRGLRTGKKKNFKVLIADDRDEFLQIDLSIIIIFPILHHRGTDDKLSKRCCTFALWTTFSDCNKFVLTSILSLIIWINCGRV